MTHAHSLNILEHISSSIFLVSINYSNHTKRKQTVKLLISPKDTIEKLVLEDVLTYSEQVNTLMVVFTDGRVRNYPFIHIWYYQAG